MPRYFFHMRDGSTVLDAEGTELPDLKAARDEAIRACGEMLRDIPNTINDGECASWFLTRTGVSRASESIRNATVSRMAFP
jgi:hypothetical protein